MIGFVRCECLIYDAQSLKEKRMVLQRIITRLKQRYNVSVSELDYQDLWQRTEIGIAAVASSRAAAEKELERSLKMIDSFPEIERAKTTYEWF
ncbi:DUF503 domain-containing protein [Bacillus marinisedimentorum]|uniref:DUF503 domain-containing protein n=1 Tax=Bacillus marinisedimentorum TaxID=1821260 RepID=UPI0007E13C2D|nr:DUF503 family protein [Bacillus marinisedimentorum]